MNLVCSTKHCYQNLCTSERCSGGKHSKDRLTGMAAFNALGEKILMFVIGKSVSPKCFKHVRNLPCRYRSQKKAWMNGTLFEEWLHELDHKLEMLWRKVVMIVDNCPAHLDVSGLKAINLQLLPPNTTSTLLYFFFYFINNVNRIATECLDFAVEGFHCLKNSLITKIEA